jgi:hypothetical protein
MSDTTHEPNAQIDPLAADGDTESLALAVADAIRRLIAERNALRSQVRALEREVINLRAKDADLRRHITLICDNYRRLTTEFVTQGGRIDEAIRSVIHEPTESDVANQIASG